jgi:hypothetical protein
MVVTHFTGVVHPERANVNVGALTVHASGDIEARVQLSIEASQIWLSVATEAVVNPAGLKNAMQRFVAKVVDCAGFTLGCGYDVELVQLIEEGKDGPIVFGVGYPMLRANQSSVSFEELLHATQGEDGLYLERALRDLSDAIRRPYDSPFHCYRAIETIMQYFKFLHGIEDDKKGWELMRSALHVARDEVMRIKQFADPLRHGAGLKRLDGSERDEAVLFTRNVIASFVVYRKKDAPQGTAP